MLFRGAMDAPELNLDVLANVCEFLTEVSDILSLAATCSSVHVVAVGWLLRMRPIYLKSGSNIRRFHSFLFADAPSRAPHVRAIHINLWWPEAQAVDDCSLLLDILTSCQHLQHVTLVFEQIALRAVSDPRFLQAIATIPTLRSFSLRAQFINPLILLPHIHAPLRMLHIDCLNVKTDFRYPAVLEHFLPRVVGRNLQKLELDGFAVDLDDTQTPIDLPMSSISNPMPYPAVRSLVVHSLKGKPLLDHLQRLFPKLDGTLHLSRLDMRLQEETYADIRAAN